MSVRYTERQNNTPEQVRAYLREALAVVAELDPPEHLRAPVFRAAIDLTSSKQVSAEVIAPGILGAVPTGRL